MATGDGLSRPVFFDRQSLTRADLNSLVDYVRETRHRHNRNVVGWGVTSGLPVAAVAGKPWEVTVGRGSAIMPSGEEVEVPEQSAPFDVCAAARACLGIPGPCPAPLDLGAPQNSGVRSVDFTKMPDGSTGPNPRAVGGITFRVLDSTGQPTASTQIVQAFHLVGLAAGARTVIGLESPVDSVRIGLFPAANPPTVVARDASGAELDRQAVTTPRQPQVLTLEGPGISTVEVDASRDPALILGVELASDVYLALCPDETPDCFRPGIPEKCLPPGGDMHPSRIREGYRLTVLCALPEGHARPSCEQTGAMVCGPQHVPPPPAGGPDCVVIATLTIGNEGIAAVHEFRDRRRILPQWLLTEREQCRCKTPDPTPTPTPTPLPTIFTPSILTRPSIFTVLTPITPFTLFPDPTLFTIATVGTPSLFTRPNLPTLFPIPGGPRGPVAFDPVAGREMAVGTVSGIGDARTARLREIGVETVTDFVEHGSAELAAALGLSEVRIAELQDLARRSTVEREDG